MSPGEKQRVALARALAGAPDLFLFDEPFSALDAQTRDQLREELLSFLRALSIPAIFVTHDHTDAMTLADKIVVLRDGVMMQSGPAAEVFQKPASSFVARFVGVENILRGRITEISGAFATLAVGDRTLRAAGTGGDFRGRKLRPLEHPGRGCDVLPAARRPAAASLESIGWKAASSACAAWGRSSPSGSTVAFR